jgi:hypothetical protein
MITAFKLARIVFRRVLRGGVLYQQLGRVRTAWRRPVNGARVTRGLFVSHSRVRGTAGRIRHGKRRFGHPNGSVVVT